MISESFTRSVSLFVIGIMLIGVPAAATTVAVYGSTSGFLPESHDMETEYEIPGNSGGLLDQTVDGFTDPMIDVIFIGNDADFSSGTALAIEEAVWDGKVLVVSYPATEKFGESLPVVSGTTAEGSATIVVKSLSNGIARSVFSGLSKTFTASENVTRLTGTLKPGAISLLSFDDSGPALAYRSYGSGYVVEWMIATPETYLGNTNADTVNYRVIDALLEEVKGPSTTTVATTAVPITTTVTSETGTALIQSSPLGALIYIDGIYQGKTPLRLEDLPAGYHSVRLTLDGYYDFDGSAYVVGDETITVFGSLQEAPVTSATTMATPVPTTAIPTTAAPTETTSSSSDALANPTVIAAGIGIVTAGIGAYATIYTHKGKEEPKKKE